MMVSRETKVRESFKKILLPYQLRFIEDKSQKRIVLKARQIGMSFTIALDAVLKALERSCVCLIVSASERQALEVMEKIRMHIQAMKNIPEFSKLVVLEKETKTEIELKLGKIRSRILSLPANPATVRGFSGHVFLDEFAMMRDDREIFRALYPSITWGYTITVVSTPRGKQNLFYELWTHGEGWSKHKISIWDAIREGLEVDIESIRKGTPDPELFAQEYECQFIDEETALLTYELISSCEDGEAWVDINLDKLKELQGTLYLGFDVARKGDLSVITLCEKVGDVLWVRGIKEMKGVDFATQRKILFSFLPYVSKACIDATGLGMQIAEEAVQNFGFRVLPVTFTQKSKEEMAFLLLRKFQDRLIRIPPYPALREDLHSVRKIVTQSGNIRLESGREGGSHADRFWSLALAVYASVQEEVLPPIVAFAGESVSVIEMRERRRNRWFEIWQGGGV